MGFSREDAQLALKIAFNNAERALEFLANVASAALCRAPILTFFLILLFLLLLLAYRHPLSELPFPFPFPFPFLLQLQLQLQVQVRVKCLQCRWGRYRSQVRDHGQSCRKQRT
jgi:hypothetical protein